MAEDGRAALSRLADELLEQVAELRRHYTAIAQLLDRVAEPAEPEQGAGGPGGPEADPIQMLAVELALAGRTREEVDAYVREHYGFSVEPAVLDRIFEQDASAG